MKNVLIIWGGWAGHHPRSVATRVGEMLASSCTVTVTSDFAVLMNEDLTQYDVIVPTWSCGIKSDYYLDPLLRAVQGGVGLATFHGGINWFEDERYYRMLGALYLFDSSDEQFTVAIADKDHPITADLTDFSIVSDQYRLQTDPTNHLLATADFARIRTPIAWTRTYGAGRVFYTSLAHSPEHFFESPNITMILNAITWCARD
ncbi:MAG: ThuA domain-containing protein [Cellulomonas sp.]